MVDGVPAPSLRGIVRSYRGYSFSGLEPGTHQGLPSANVTFIVSLGDPIDIVSMPGDQSPSAFGALVGGLHTRPATIRHRGTGAGIAIEMSPLACRQLFGMPAAELATQVVELMDLFGTRGNELVEGLNASASWAARFETLDDVLVAGIRDVDGPSPEMRRTWQLIVHGGAGSRIAVIARDVGYSRRHLSTRFLQEFGVTPKTAVRVARFDRACELLDAGVPIARAAIQAGYDDHAHLASEWRDLSGMTPTAWLGDDLRDRAPREGDLRAASA